MILLGCATGICWDRTGYPPPGTSPLIPSTSLITKQHLFVLKHSQDIFILERGCWPPVLSSEEKKKKARSCVIGETTQTPDPQSEKFHPWSRTISVRTTMTARGGCFHESCSCQILAVEVLLSGQFHSHCCLGCSPPGISHFTSLYPATGLSLITLTPAVTIPNPSMKSGCRLFRLSKAMAPQLQQQHSHTCRLCFAPSTRALSALQEVNLIPKFHAWSCIIWHQPPASTAGVRNKSQRGTEVGCSRLSCVVSNLS